MRDLLGEERGLDFQRILFTMFSFAWETFVLVFDLQPILTRKPTSKVGPGIVCSRGCIATPPTGGAWFRERKGARGKDCSIGCLDEL